MPYRNWADTDTLNAADLNAMTADPQQAEIATAEGTSSTSYTDLATAGPAVTVATLVSGQSCLVFISARCDNAAVSTTAAHISFAVSGVESLSATDANGALLLGNSSNIIGGTLTKVALYTAAVTGSHTFTIKYKVTGSQTGTFATRRITVKKF